MLSRVWLGRVAGTGGPAARSSERCTCDPPRPWLLGWSQSDRCAWRGLLPFGGGSGPRPINAAGFGKERLENHIAGMIFKVPDANEEFYLQLFTATPGAGSKFQGRGRSPGCRHPWGGIEIPGAWAVPSSCDGGVKVGNENLVIESMLEKVDTSIVGGGMGFTFLRARGLCVWATGSWRRTSWTWPSPWR